jgi:hypothetical protein
MTAKLQLEGVYKVQGLTLTDPDKDFRLIIDTRRNAQSRKPARYLIAKRPDGTDFPDTGTRSQYISSLYPVPGSATWEGAISWTIDYRQTTYQVTQNGDTVTITKAPQTDPTWPAESGQTDHNGLVYQKPLCTTVVQIDQTEPDQCWPF